MPYLTLHLRVSLCKVFAACAHRVIPPSCESFSPPRLIWQSNFSTLCSLASIINCPSASSSRLAKRKHLTILTSPASLSANNAPVPFPVNCNSVLKTAPAHIIALAYLASETSTAVRRRREATENGASRKTAKRPSSSMTTSACV